MCQICVDIVKGKMTFKEALSALGELVVANKDDFSKKEHFMEVAEKIIDMEELDRDSRETD